MKISKKTCCEKDSTWWITYHLFVSTHSILYIGCLQETIERMWSASDVLKKKRCSWHVVYKCNQISPSIYLYDELLESTTSCIDWSMLHLVLSDDHRLKSQPMPPISIIRSTKKNQIVENNQEDSFFSKDNVNATWDRWSSFREEQHKEDHRVRILLVLSVDKHMRHRDVGSGLLSLRI